MIQSNNDWDQLEECFVGIADDVHHPPMDPSVMSFSYAGYAVSYTHLTLPTNREV